MTTSRYDPDVWGYTRATRVKTKGSERENESETRNVTKVRKDA